MPSAAAASVAVKNQRKRDQGASRAQPIETPVKSVEMSQPKAKRDLFADFPKNTLVELVGLKERGEYNGCRATVCAVEPRDGRVVVLVDIERLPKTLNKTGKKTKKMRIHPANLEKVGLDSPDWSYMGQNNAPPSFPSMNTIQLREKKESCGGFWLCLLEKQLQTRMFYEKSAVQIFITSLIIINFILILIGNLYPLLGQGDLSIDTIRSYQEVQEIVDTVFLWVFTVELLINLFAHWFCDFFRDGWNVFDFLIISASHILAPLGLDASAIRILRALRVTRLIGKMRSLRIIVNTLMLSLKSVVILFMLLLLLIAIFSIMSITTIGTPMRDALYRPCQSLDPRAEVNCDSLQDVAADDKLKCKAQAAFINSQCTSFNNELHSCRAVDLADDFKVAFCARQTVAHSCRQFGGYCRKHSQNNPEDEVEADGNIDTQQRVAIGQVTILGGDNDGQTASPTNLIGASGSNRIEVLYNGQRRFAINSSGTEVTLSAAVTCQGRMLDRVEKYGFGLEEQASQFPNKGICEGIHSFALYSTDYGCGDSRSAGCGRWDEANEDWILINQEPGWEPEANAEPKCVFEPLCQTWEDYTRHDTYDVEGLKSRCQALGGTDRLNPLLDATCVLPTGDDVAFDGSEEDCTAQGGASAKFTALRDINMPRSWFAQEDDDFSDVHSQGNAQGLYGGMCNWDENSQTAYSIMDDWGGTGRFDNLGEALYSFFTIVTFEAWPDIVAPIHKSPWPMGQPWGTLFFILYILLSAFLLMNMFVTIFLDKMTEAKEYVKDQDSKRTDFIAMRASKLKKHLKRITAVREEKKDRTSRLTASGANADDLRKSLHGIDKDYRDEMKKFSISKMKEKKKDDPENYNEWLNGVDNAPKLQTVRMLPVGFQTPLAPKEGGAGYSGRDVYDDEKEELRKFMELTEKSMGSILGRLQGLEKPSK